MQDVVDTPYPEMAARAAAAVRGLLDDCDDDDPMRSRLEEVRAVVDRLAQAEAPRRGGPPPGTLLDLNSVITQLTPSLRRLLGPFIAFDTALHPEGVWVSAERHQIEQIVLGLVINAREALPLGGTIVVATRIASFDHPVRFRFGALGPGEWGILEVRDNGTAVDHAAMMHLLDPVARGVRFDSSLSLGTISAVVARLQGEVILDTRGEQGSILGAAFEAASDPALRDVALSPAVAILVADDDEWNRLSLARALRRAGFGILEAEHGDTALELLDDVAGPCVRLVLAAAELPCHGQRRLSDSLRDERPELGLITMHRGDRAEARRRGDVRVTELLSPGDLVAMVRTRLDTR